MSTARLLVTLSILMLLACPYRPAHADSYMFVAFGDTRSQADVHRAVVAGILKVHPEFILQTGDLVANGGDERQWKQFDEIEKPLRDAGIGYYPARGNHDLGSYYILRAPKHYESGNGYYYAVTLHKSLFLAVDSMDPDGVSAGSPQYLWLQSQLAGAKGKYDHVFVFFHESPFSVGPHGPNPEAAQYLHPLFVKYKPTAVFCGHDHLYYRTIRDGVHYFVTGGGGAPLYEPENANLAIKGDVYASVYHYIKIVIHGDDITATAYQVDPLGHTPDKVIDTVSWSD